MNYLDGLNPEQRKAVEHINGPVMVIAGAGSGKTRVLTYRIAHMLKNGVSPFNILSLTFTNKAAKEMKERIAGIVGNSVARNLWMGTFHSVFAKILRIEAEKLGYTSNFTIYDTDDSKSLIKSILEELQLDDKVYKPALVLNRISAAKTNLISSSAYLNNVQIQNEDNQSAKPKLGMIYDLYTHRCFKSDAMDFDDLLFKTNILLRDFPDVLHKYQHKFKYILVDEYQDTNFSQYVIVKKLAALNENICVVGDDAQSIYAFRGANIQNILNFRKDYPDYVTFKLEQNYRSTKMIVNAANSIIAHNKQQLEKNIWTSNDEGNRIKVYRAAIDNEEGTFVANSIFETKMGNQAANSDFAILYRTNTQSRVMEEALRRLNIPYKIYGGLSFYKRKEIKDLLAYFRLTINHNDEEALKRIINYPARGIGKATLDKIILTANEQNRPIWYILENMDAFNVNVGSGAKGKLENFILMIKKFSSELKKEDAYALANSIAKESGILHDLYSDKSPEGVSKHDNIQELLNGVKDFSEQKTSLLVDADTGELQETTEERIRTLDEYMSDIALLTDADDEKEGDRNKVSLMTIHASKGLEFPYVYIVGVEENLFPSQLSLSSQEDLEEERRLFYVALTRAEKGATISYATTRYKWGNVVQSEPSRFIEEIDIQCLEMPMRREQYTEPVFNSKFNNSPKSAPAFSPTTTGSFVAKKLVRVQNIKPKDAASAFKGDDIIKLQVGMTVEHEKFGIGKITQMEGALPNVKATILFDNVGQKQLILSYAKLKIVE